MIALFNLVGQPLFSTAFLLSITIEANPAGNAIALPVFMCRECRSTHYSCITPNFGLKSGFRIHNQNS